MKTTRHVEVDDESADRTASWVDEIAALPAPRDGRFGDFGGQYVAETLMPAIAELEAAWRAARGDAGYWAEVQDLLVDYVGRPSLLYHARRLSATVGAQVYLKREDLNHTGAHKINNCIGQAVLARRMGKRRLIAETGAGQHGVASATVAALFGIPCEVYMGAEDVVRQALNVERMRLLGAQVHAVESGTRTLKDAMNEALRDWVTNVGDTFYLIGSVAGPHPYPWMVRDLQSVIGREARAQILAATGRLPDACVACVGGGSNAGGLFAPFVRDASVRLVGVEAAGDGIATGRHAATLGAGRVGVLHGSKSYVLAHDDGQIAHAHSISAGLDYPGVGPEHAAWKDSGRAMYVSRTDEQALAGLERLARTEGILCALETAHAIAALDDVAAMTGPGGAIIVGLSGRGDKDMVTVAQKEGAMTADRGASLRAVFERGARDQRAVLVAYLTFGDPDPETSIEVLAACANAGAGVIELGVPFSDPSADGPSIQRAMERALAAGGSLGGALDAVAVLRKRGIATPIVLFGYYNPMFIMGPEKFAARAAAAGIDAVLTVDLPIDELDELAAPLGAHDVAVVPLIAPTSTPDRIARLARFAPPFVYYITLKGVTGVKAAAPVDPERLAAIRAAASAPVAVGFGIRTAADAARFAAIADGVVVGTVLVDQVPAGPAEGAPERVASTVRELAVAMVR